MRYFIDGLFYLMQLIDKMYLESRKKRGSFIYKTLHQLIKMITERNSMIKQDRPPNLT